MLKLLLLSLALIELSHSFDLSILHTNDIHARFEETNQYGGMCPEGETKCYGGVARRKTMVDQLRAEKNNSLLLCGGDHFQGTFWFTVFNGEATAYFNKKIGYDAMPFGNHEFDKGLVVLGDYLKNITEQIPFVSSNINWNGEEAGKYVQPWVIKDVSGVKVGIMGYTTPQTRELVQKGNVGAATFEDEITALTRAVGEIQANDSSVKILIAIGHAGYAMDQKIGKEVAGIDIVVGGHTNTFLYSPVGEPPSTEAAAGPYPTVVDKDDGGKALVVQAFTAGKYIGVLDVVFDDQGVATSWSGNPVLLNSSVVKDPTIALEMIPFRRRVEEIGGKPVANSTVFLNGSCRLSECNLGNLMADAFLYTAVKLRDDDQWTSAAIVLFNGGSVRTSLEKGEIAFKNILEASPFGNELVQVRLKGSTIKKVFEHSVSEYDPIEQPGRFLQMSGASVVYNVGKPVGQRVRKLMLRCRECPEPVLKLMEPNSEYEVLMTTYMVSGGDGYSMIPEESLSEKSFDLLDVDLIDEYMKKIGIVYPQLEGRITFMSDDDDRDPQDVSDCSSASLSHYSLAFILFAVSGLFLA